MAMTWYMGIFLFMALLGSSTLSYQVFQMITLDARCRGLKHPLFWGLFSIGGNNGSTGLILYLLGRQRYPSSMTAKEHAVMDARKKRAGVSLCFLAVGTIGLMVSCIFGGVF